MTDTMRQGSEDNSTIGSKFTNGNSSKKLNTETNGHRQSNSRSNAISNGFSNDSWFGHDREEVARLLIQGLEDLGYSDSANTLIRESGFELESPTVAAFRQSVLDGEWSEAEELLCGPRNNNNNNNGSLESSTNRGSHHVGFAVAEGIDVNELRFLIRRQKYLELLESREHAEALTCLRQEITPLHRDTGQLHILSGLLVCPTAEDVRVQASWDGARGQSRQILLTALSRAIAPSVMIPGHRLATLLTHVKQAQVSKCHYHNPINKLSLFTDHVCDRDQFPLRTIKELPHKDEVWYLQFSNDGTKLATAGQMNDITIWETHNWTKARTLVGHTRFVALLAWKPDDTRLVSCSDDRTARIWDPVTGDLLYTIENHGEPVTSAVWTPDGKYILTGSLDRVNSLFQWTDTAEWVYDWPSGYRINALAISPDGERLVVLSSDCQIHVYNFHTREEKYSIKLNKNLTCVTISRDGNFMLVNMSENELQLIDINRAEIVERFLGHKQASLSIRSIFGGGDETLVITGSEDGKVYVFNKDRGTLIDKLVGHIGPVNAIAWNPAQACMFASAGDDSKVRIWTKSPGGPASRLQPLPIPSSNHRSYGSYGSPSIML